MSQTVLAVINGNLDSLELPSPDGIVVPGVRWGRFEELFTPAYWATQVWLNQTHHKYSSYRLGRTLREEIAACILGGHGVPAYVGTAAFLKLKQCGLLEAPTPTHEVIQRVLEKPLVIEQREIRYRFAVQRSKYLHCVLRRLDEDSPSQTCFVELRQWLLSNLGIGPKTASWITRNWLSCEHVAIIDVHIYRAGVIAGFFDRSKSICRHYFHLEERFLQFSDAIKAPAPVLDTMMWCQMKDVGRIATKMFDQM